MVEGDRKFYIVVSRQPIAVKLVMAGGVNMNLRTPKRKRREHGQPIAPEALYRCDSVPDSVNGCRGNCEAFKSTFRGCKSVDKDYPVDCSHLKILGYGSRTIPSLNSEIRTKKNKEQRKQSALLALCRKQLFTIRPIFIQNPIEQDLAVPAQIGKVLPVICE